MSHMSTHYYHLLIALGSMQTVLCHEDEFIFTGKGIIESVMQCNCETAHLHF